MLPVRTVAKQGQGCPRPTLCLPLALSLPRSVLVSSFHRNRLNHESTAPATAWCLTIRERDFWKPRGTKTSLCARFGGQRRRKSRFGRRKDTIILSMSADEACPVGRDHHDLQFWNLRVANRFGSNVVAVEETPGCIRQRNCLIQPLRLKLENGCQKHVVVKCIDLDLSKFRDENHLKRTEASYRVETSFYENLAERCVSNGARVSEPVHVEWNGTDAGVVIVLEDLRCDPSGEVCDLTGRSPDQRLALTFEEAKTALSWLARFHGAMWGCMAAVEPESGGLWPRGCYWSLDKRQADVPRMSSEWDKVLDTFSETFPEAFGRSSVRELGAKLAKFAELLDGELEPRDLPPTLVHGDFKTANLFFFDDDVAVCDFQWTGPGLGVRDVVYLLWTSVHAQIVWEQETALLQHYHMELSDSLSKRNRSTPMYTWDEFFYHCDVAFLDYVRFLVGSMWGAVTLASCKKFENSINQGMHKRNAEHLVKMVLKADSLLCKHEDRLRSRIPDNGVVPNGVVSAPSNGLSGVKLMQSLLSTCIVLSEDAGNCIRTILGASNGKIESREKGEDGPQTEADIQSEKVIVHGLLQKFPQATIIGEEGVSNALSNDHQTTRAVDQVFLDMIGEQCPAAWGDVRIEDLVIWVDPMDGTKEFLDGNYDGVTVLIGIAFKGTPIAGVIHQPFATSTNGSAGRTWWGGEELGVYLDQDRHDLSMLDTSQCIVATTRSNPSALVEEYANKLKPDKVLEVGGVGCKSILLLTGRISHYVFPSKGTKRWDTCAPEALLSALGGRMVDRNGKKYDYGPDCDAGNYNGVLGVASKDAWGRLCTCLGLGQDNEAESVV